MSGLRFDGWVPFRLFWQGGVPGVEWFYLGSRRFTEPFFEATVNLAVQSPFNSLFRFRTLIAELAEWHAVSPGLRPTGFIFHLSRCGSTLITQMLASLPENVVLSEPGLLDRMIRSHVRAPGASVEQRVAWLRWLVSALGQPRTGDETHLFIKFEPRHILDFPLLRLAFPDVPWIFVYRNPVEVLVSNVSRPSALVTKGIVSLDATAFDLALAAGMEDDEYAARMLGIVAEAAVRHTSSSQGMLVDYTQLPDVVWGGLANHFGLSFTGADVERMKHAATSNAKEPTQRFQSDTDSKKSEASAHLRLLADQFLMPHYRRLEELRRSWSS